MRDVGIDGFFVALKETGPDVFENTGEFISEFFAELCGVGFWPGGKLGITLSTIVSLILNVFEIIYGAKLLRGINKKFSTNNW